MAANDLRRSSWRGRRSSRVFFNGAAAEANYRRLVSVDPSLSYGRLPSTSPAHTMALRRNRTRGGRFLRAARLEPLDDVLGLAQPQAGLIAQHLDRLDLLGLLLRAAAPLR